MNATSAWELCAYCPRLCRHVCPTALVEARETLIPTNLTTLLLLGEAGEVVLDHELRTVFDHCILCGRCTAVCIHEATPWSAFRTARHHEERPLDEELWAPAPFAAAGGGSETWLLVGSLRGLDPATIEARLAADAQRLWRLPTRGLPTRLHEAWAGGHDPRWSHYVEGLREELERLRPIGVAWSDPHEGKAVRAFLELVGWRGPRGYAPQLLGLVAEERTACTARLDGAACCGAAGGYPEAAPEAAAALAATFPDPGRPVPGICRAHLVGAGRDPQTWTTDWDPAR